MNLLLAADDCSLGGHTCFMLGLAQGLSRRGHRVRSFFFQDAGFLSSFSRQCETVLGDVDDLRAMLVHGNWDLVHGDSCMVDLPAALKERSSRTRLVITRHAWNAPMGWHRGNCDAYTTVSASSAALCQPYTDHAMAVIPNGVDINSLCPQDGPAPPRPVIAWCGRSRDPVKDWARFVSATWHLSDEFDFRVADATPPPAARFRQEGGGHLAQRRRVERDELTTFFSEVARSGGALLCTSRAEGMPLALLEAMACGCPVIGPDVRGVRDVLHGPLRRWLYPARATDLEVAAFVRAAVKDLAAPELRQQFRDHVVEHYSLDRMVDRYEVLYRRLLTGRVVSGAPIPEAAARLWEFAAEVRRKGRCRDAMFAARAAVQISPGSLLRTDRILLAAACGSASRLRGARYFLGRAQEKFGSQQYREGIRHLAHACRLHPGALFSPESPLRLRGRV